MDKNATGQDSFKWLRDMISHSQQIFNTFNWGANCEKFREATALWRLTLSNLVKFSDSRFANAKRKVFKNIHHQFTPIISCTKAQIMEGVRNRSGMEASDSKVRETADNAREFGGKNYEPQLSVDTVWPGRYLWEFWCHCAGHANGSFITILEVGPQHRGRRKNIALGQNHKDCKQFFKPEEKIKCLWPMNHADTKSYMETNMIRDMHIFDRNGVEAAGLGLLKRRLPGKNIVMAGEDTEKKSEGTLLTLVNELSAGTSEKVYSSEGKAVIEATRVVLDIPTLALKLKENGACPI